jgi:hypothetical protein
MFDRWTPLSAAGKAHAKAAAQILRPWIPWLIVAAGIALRCSQYSFDRSLFLDEAFVATNIAHRSVAELCQPLEFDQRAPAGFLAGVKLATLALGRSDLVLRLLPLISGIVSVVLFPVLCRRLLSERAANLALLLLAVSPPLIFMSSDLKQYSTDALMTIAILLSCATADLSRWTARDVATVGLVGAGALWFSFPAVFVLAGVGVVLVAALVSRRRWGDLPKISIVGLLWAIGFAGLWWLQLRFFEDEPGWKKLWDGAFMPLPPRSLGDLLWFPRRFMHMVTNPIGIEFPGIAGLACLAGIGALYRQSRHRAALLLAPVAVAILASGLRIYPVSGRSIIFMAPLLVLMIAAGIDCVRHTVVQRGLAWMWVFVAACALFQPALSAKEHIVNRQMYKNTTFWDYKFEEIKPLMSHMRAAWQPGDLVYLYSQTHVAFDYYGDQFGFAPSDSVRGMSAGLLNPRWEEIESDLARLSGRKRVWVLFTHNWKLNEVNERKLYRYFLDRMGTCLDRLELPDPADAAVYLYDLSNPPPHGSPRSNGRIAAMVNPSVEASP